MGTKIDLDELERKARAADPALWSGLRADAFNVDRWADDRSVANAQHIALNSPPVTLALIARIRELENALFDWGDARTSGGTGPSPLSLIALLEKGAVLK